MTQDLSSRGGAPVGYLNELGPVESHAVMLLRMWCHDADTQMIVKQEFERGLGPDQGQRPSRALERLCDLCVSHGRRPLMRHHVECRCLGGDESCFANFIAYAAEGAIDDAVMVATTIVRPDQARKLAHLAAVVGRALNMIHLRPKTPRQTHFPECVTLQ